MTRVAIVHDWLVEKGGAELVLKELIACYPNADLFSLLDFFGNEDREFYLAGKSVATSFLQNMPMAKNKYRNYLPLMPIAIEQFDLTKYDLVISSSYAVAKGVITGPDQLHVCYCHSPIRYAWDMQYQYLSEAKLTNGLKSIFVKWVLHKLKNWDYRSSASVDSFFANSYFISRRIMKFYKRDSIVINPPVDISAFSLCENKDDFYLTASRMVPYKKIDLIVKAFSKMPEKKLIVIGAGPDFDKISKLATDNVIMMGYQSFSVLKDYMQRAKAFVFAAEEDFGIVPVEAQACGTPVIAFRKGGALETVSEGISGVFFDEQTTESIIGAVNSFENITFIPSVVRDNSLKFSIENFRSKIKESIDERLAAFKK